MRNVSRVLALAFAVFWVGACGDTGVEPEIAPDLARFEAEGTLSEINDGGMVDLVAGQHMVVGYVEVTGSDPINVKFVMDPGWCLTETHVAIGDELEDLPQNGGGNPKVGNFPYGDDYLECVSEWDVDMEAPDPGEEPWAIAAHAVVQGSCVPTPDVQYLFGILDGPNADGLGDGDLYRVDPETGDADLIYDFDTDPSGDRFSPNGLAFDQSNMRLYFSVDPDGDPTSGGINLYYFDVDVSGATPMLVSSGGDFTLDQTPIYNASWYNGEYYYIPNRTDNLWKATFNGDGTQVTAAAEVCTDLVPGGGATSMYFGDIAISDQGVLYGWARRDSDLQYFFFQTNLDCTGKSAINVTAAHDIAFNLQLAFGDDGQLWGHQALSALGGNAGQWYTVDMTTGAISTAFSTSPSFTDISAGYMMEGEDPNCAEPETAWGDGETGAGFPGRSWATYFNYSPGL